jgi:hypothetical protein
MTQLAETFPAIDGVIASTAEPLPFDRSLEIRAFLLVRERENLLIYSARSLDVDLAAVEAARGVSRGTTATTGCCSPATRSTYATESGARPCSTGAIAHSTRTAWS